MIDGAHVILFSKDAAKDRAFLRDVIGFPALDIGEGWMLFKAPPSELAVHPSDENDKHELYLMCDDLEAEVSRLDAAGVTCGPVSDQGWGRVTRIPMPGGGQLGLYQPRHARP